MNAKIVFTIVVAFCAVQQPAVAGVDISGIVNQVLGAIQTTVQGMIDQFKNATGNVLADIKAQVKQAEENIVNDIKNEFSNINQDTAEIKACFQTLGADFKTIEGEIESKVQNFLIKEGITILPVVGKLNATLNEIKADAQADIAAGQACGKLGNVILSAACYASLVGTVTSQGATIKAEVAAEVPQVQAALAKLLSDIKTTGTQIINQSIAEAEADGQATVDCIKAAIASKAAAAADSTETSS